MEENGSDFVERMEGMPDNEFGDLITNRIARLGMTLPVRRR